MCDKVSGANSLSLGFFQPLGLLTLWQPQHCMVIVFVLHYYLSARTLKTLAENEGMMEDESGRSTCRAARRRAPTGDPTSKVAAGRSVRRIARGLKRSPSTISREIRRNGGSQSYRANRAERSAWESLPPLMEIASAAPRSRRSRMASGRLI